MAFAKSALTAREARLAASSITWIFSSSTGRLGSKNRIVRRLPTTCLNSMPASLSPVAEPYVESTVTTIAAASGRPGGKQCRSLSLPAQAEFLVGHQLGGSGRVMQLHHVKIAGPDARLLVRRVRRALDRARFAGIPVPPADQGTGPDSDPGAQPPGRLRRADDKGRR